MSRLLEIDSAALAERFSAKCQYLREHMDDAILLRPEMAQHWFDIGNDELSLPRDDRDPRYEVTRRRGRMTINFACAVRFELAWIDLRWGGKPSVEDLIAYQLPIANVRPPPRLARWHRHLFAYPLLERDIAATLESYALYCDEWNARERDRRAPAPGAEQVGLRFLAAPGRFTVISGPVLDRFDVPRSWQQFGPGWTNFRRTPLARKDVRGAWRFVSTSRQAWDDEKEAMH